MGFIDEKEKLNNRTQRKLDTSQISPKGVTQSLVNPYEIVRKPTSNKFVVVEEEKKCSEKTSKKPGMFKKLFGANKDKDSKK
jgi:hypothetical protein